MRGYFRTFVLFLIFTAFLVGLGQLAAYYWGLDPSSLLIVMLVISFFMNFFMYFFSHKIALWGTRSKLVTPQEAPRLHRIVERVALRADIPKPQVAISHTMTPNAFATGRNPKHAVVAATAGIMQLLDDDELEGVIAHEISHVKNRDVLIATIAAAFASIVSYIGWMFLFGGRGRNGNPLLGILVWLLAPIAAMIIQLAITRGREFAADASGAKLLGRGDSLARALQKLERGVEMRPMREGNPSTSSLFIVNPFRRIRFAGMFSTHPRTEDRVRRLQELQF